MSREIIIPGAFAFVLALLLVVVMFWGSGIIGQPPSPIMAELNSAGSSVDISDILAMIDQITSMLTTISIGLFVLIGVSLSMTQSHLHRMIDIVSAIAFIASSFVSFFFAFGTRASSFSYAAFEFKDKQALRSTILWHREVFGNHALWVALSAVFAFFIVVRAIVLRTPTPTQAATVPPEQQAPLAAPDTPPEEPANLSATAQIEGQQK
ncbi:hypothetical protein [Aminobacter sp. LjRoot7]|uniref:hypothetical protein n=1 Tax=Aminobacter sp. LjRoot7 TaxID=3342335 RepID=UPI003ED06C99